MHRVCLLTGDAGADASDLHIDLLPRLQGQGRATPAHADERAHVLVRDLVSPC